MRYLILLTVAYMLTSCVSVPKCNDMIDAFTLEHKGNVMPDVVMGDDNGALVLYGPKSDKEVDVLCIELKQRTEPTTAFCIEPRDMDKCTCEADARDVVVRCGTGTVTIEGPQTVGN